jgi:hopanoid biosynthesis associated RND transporter like protein HpnN
LFRPQPEQDNLGFTWAAPADRFIEKNRRSLSILAIVIAAGGLGLASQARFDFDPLNLKNPQAESVSTMLDIIKDPNANPYTVDILAPSLDEAARLADEIKKLPEVDHVITLASFVPEEQDEKLELIDNALFVLGPSLDPEEIMQAPTDQETMDALAATSAALKELGEDKVAASRLAKALDAVISRKDPVLLQKLDANMIAGMKNYLAQLRTLLNAQKANLDNITEDLRRDWITADGRAKIEVHPKGDARDHRVLSAFTKAVQTVAPQSSGTAISIQGSGKTVTDAFIEAGLLGILFISLLAFIVLKRISDVIRLILPLLFAGVMTLGTMVAINLPLNFANIIALPLLLSLGVTYAIYFVSYWKNGQVAPLQSSMARAVLFSAATTLVAFGSLSLSSHTGTAGMGGLLTIALIYSLLSTFFVLPLLLGKGPSVKPR